jgi:hypothetical protein
LSRGDEATSSASAVTGGIEGPIISHKKRSKGAPDIIRAVCHVPVSDQAAALESFRAVLSSSEIRHSWDSVTEKQETLEIVEPNIRVVRNFTKVGWPSRCDRLPSDSEYIGTRAECWVAVPAIL